LPARIAVLAAAFTPSLPGLSCALLSKERNLLRRTSGGAKLNTALSPAVQVQMKPGAVLSLAYVLHSGKHRMLA